MSVLFSVDKADAKAVSTLNEYGEMGLETRSLGADTGLFIAVAASFAAAVNAATALINHSNSSSKNIIKISGVTYDLRPANKDAIIEALNEYFKDSSPNSGRK